MTVVIKLVLLGFSLAVCAGAARVGEVRNMAELQADLVGHTSGGELLAGKELQSSVAGDLSVVGGGSSRGIELEQTAGSGSYSEVPPHKGALQSQDNYKQESPVGGSTQFVVPQTNEKGDLPLVYNLSEITKLIWSPFDLVKKISDTFRLSQDKLVDKIGKGAVFGVEAILTPVIASLKIIEKVFVPDHCRLKLVCQIGSKFGFIKDTIAKFSPGLLHGTHHLKALTDGIIGQNCETLFKECGLKLRKPFETLKN